MRVRFNIDFELSPRVKRALLLGLPIGIVLAGSIAWAGVPNVFKDGDSLSATTMNDNFTSLDQRIAKLETQSNKQTADGGFSVGGRYCGQTGNTTGDLSGLSTAGLPYAKARAQCAMTCNSASAHMCSGDELVKSEQLGQHAPSGWYTTGTNLDLKYECKGWTDNTASYIGPAWSGAVPYGPSSNNCNTSYPVLCCD